MTYDIYKPCPACGNRISLRGVARASMVAGVFVRDYYCPCCMVLLVSAARRAQIREKRDLRRKPALVHHLRNYL